MYFHIVLFLNICIVVTQLYCNSAYKDTKTEDIQLKDRSILVRVTSHGHELA